MGLLKEILYRIRGEYTTEKLITMGLTVGDNFTRMKGSILDPSHCWLIEIGDNVTMAPNVHVLCHDASTKLILGYTKIGRVNIGNNVFIGAGTIILPGVDIGDNVIVGANSTVTHSIESGIVVAGNPAKMICTTQKYIDKEKNRMSHTEVYGKEYTISGGITYEKKIYQKEKLKGKVGYVI